jgi:hypothetical protein
VSSTASNPHNCFTTWAKREKDDHTDTRFSVSGKPINSGRFYQPGSPPTEQNDIMSRRHPTRLNSQCLLRVRLIFFIQVLTVLYQLLVITFFISSRFLLLPNFGSKEPRSRAFSCIA